jgi:uncharacterized protein YciI
VTELEPHTLVLLRWRPDKVEYPDGELERLQAEHLTFLGSLYDRGLLLSSGPLADRDDESLRGICVYTVSPDEARRHALEDPLVRAGRMEPVTFTWLARAGSVVFGT